MTRASIQMSLLVSLPLTLIGCSSDSAENSQTDDDLSSLLDSELQPPTGGPRVRGREWRVHFTDPGSGSTDSTVVRDYSKIGGEYLDQGEVESWEEGALTDLVPEGEVGWITKVREYFLEGEDTLHLTIQENPYFWFDVDNGPWTEEEDGLYLEPEGGRVYAIGTAFLVSIAGAKKAGGFGLNLFRNFAGSTCPVHYQIEDLATGTQEIDAVKEFMEFLRGTGENYAALSEEDLLAGITPCLIGGDYYSGLPDAPKFVSFQPEQMETRVIQVFPEKLQIINRFDEASGDNFMPLLQEALLKEGRLVTFPTESLSR